MDEVCLALTKVMTTVHSIHIQVFKGSSLIVTWANWGHACCQMQLANVVISRCVFSVGLCEQCGCMLCLSLALSPTPSMLCLPNSKHHQMVWRRIIQLVVHNVHYHTCIFNNNNIFLQLLYISKYGFLSLTDACSVMFGSMLPMCTEWVYDYKVYKM